MEINHEQILLMTYVGPDVIEHKQNIYIILNNYMAINIIYINIL